MADRVEKIDLAELLGVPSAELKVTEVSTLDYIKTAEWQPSGAEAALVEPAAGLAGPIVIVSSSTLTESGIEVSPLAAAETEWTGNSTGSMALSSLLETDVWTSSKQVTNSKGSLSPAATASSLASSRAQSNPAATEEGTGRSASITKSTANAVEGEQAASTFAAAMTSSALKQTDIKMAAAQTAGTEPADTELGNTKVGNAKVMTDFGAATISTTASSPAANSTAILQTGPAQAASTEPTVMQVGAATGGVAMPGVGQRAAGTVSAAQKST